MNFSIFSSQTRTPEISMSSLAEHGVTALESFAALSPIEEANSSYIPFNTHIDILVVTWLTQAESPYHFGTAGQPCSLPAKLAKVSPVVVA